MDTKSKKIEIQSLTARITEAIENGEILRIRYDRGSQPGSIRDIRPLVIEGKKLRARDESSIRSKLFFIDTLYIVSIDTPLTYIAKKYRRVEINCSIATRDWEFYVPLPAFALALDIIETPRQEMNLKTQKNEIRRVWTQGNPINYRFASGDTFHTPADAGEAPWGSLSWHACIQVRSANGRNVLIDILEFTHGELHTAKRGVEMSMKRLADILENGFIAM